MTDLEPPAAATPPASAEPTGTFRGIHRLHPTSVLFGMLAIVRKFFFGVLIAILFASTGNNTVLVLTAIAVVMTTIREIIEYLTLGYEIVGGELKVDQGWIFRRHRTVPIERIQNIDQLQNPIHKFFDVAEVRVETASGKEPEAVLRVLAVAELESLRAAVFGTTAEVRDGAKVSPGNDDERVDDAPSNEPAQPSDDVVLTISPWTLALYGSLSLRGLVIIPFAWTIYAETMGSGFWDFGDWFDDAYGTAKSLRPGAYAWLIPPLILVLLTTGSAAWFMIRFYDYRMTRRGDDLRVSCGLFTRVSATIPRRRIQLISVQRNLWARVCGLATIRVETAGGSGGAGNNEDAASLVARKWFVPAMPVSDVPRVLAELRDGVGDLDDLPWRPTAPGTRRRLVRLAIITAVLVALIGVAVSRPWGWIAGCVVAAVWVPIAFRKAAAMRFAITDDRVAYQNGWWTRRRSVCFVDKVQTVMITQSPLDRRWAMATLRVDSAGAGPAGHTIEVRYLADEAAAEAGQRLCQHAGELGYSG